MYQSHTLYSFYPYRIRSSLHMSPESCPMSSRCSTRPSSALPSFPAALSWTPPARSPTFRTCSLANQCKKNPRFRHRRPRNRNLETCSSGRRSMLFLSLARRTGVRSPQPSLRPHVYASIFHARLDTTLTTPVMTLRPISWREEVLP